MISLKMFKKFNPYRKLFSSHSIYGLLLKTLALDEIRFSQMYYSVQSPCSFPRSKISTVPRDSRTIPSLWK